MSPGTLAAEPESCTRLTHSVPPAVSHDPCGSFNLIFTPRFSCSFSWSYFIAATSTVPFRTEREPKSDTPELNPRHPQGEPTSSHLVLWPEPTLFKYIIRGKTRYKPCTMLPQSARGSNARDLDQLRTATKIYLKTLRRLTQLRDPPESVTVILYSTHETRKTRHSNLQTTQHPSGSDDGCTRIRV